MRYSQVASVAMTKCCSLDSSIEILEDKALPGVGLEEGGKHQRLDSHELDENVE